MKKYWIQFFKKKDTLSLSWSIKCCKFYQLNCYTWTKEQTLCFINIDIYLRSFLHAWNPLIDRNWRTIEIPLEIKLGLLLLHVVEVTVQHQLGSRLHHLWTINSDNVNWVNAWTLGKLNKYLDKILAQMKFHWGIKCVVTDISFNNILQAAPNFVKLFHYICELRKLEIFFTRTQKETLKYRESILDFLRSGNIWTLLF